MEICSPAKKRLKLSPKKYAKEESTSKILSISDLPIINIYQILSFLDADTLLTKVQLVCNFFKEIIKDDSLWKSFRSLSFQNNESISYIITIIKKCKNLMHLKIVRKIGRNFDYDKKTLHSCIFDVLSHYPQLKSFSLTNFRIGSDCEDSFRGFMKSLHKLTYLCLDKCYVNNLIGEIISEGKSLKSLCLSRCYSIEEQTFIKIFRNCQQLEHLDVSQQDTLNDKVFYSLFTECSKNIQTLFLRDISIQHNNFTYIKNCSNLCVLSIDCHFLNDKTLSQIRQLMHLKHLELSYGLLFTAVGLRKFFEKGSFSQLKYLDLTCCAGLDNSSLEMLADRCQELQCLDLSECWRVTDIGIYYVIRKCTKLCLLNLEDLKELKGAFLTELHNYLKNLILINLSFCDGISSNNLQQFIKLNPIFEIKKCKEYRVKHELNLFSQPVLLISQGMIMESCL